MNRKQDDESPISSVPNPKRQRLNDSTTTMDEDSKNENADDTLTTADAQELITELLNDIDDPIEVSVGGLSKYIPSVPLLHVNDIGIVPVPLSKSMIQILINKMDRSSFGRNLSTETDESVRKSYELTADQFECKNPKFNEAVQLLAKSASKKMGVDHHRVDAVPYKLILYEAGSHFVEHRDTEKLEGMFGTLVIQLPSIYTVENGLPVLSVKHLENEYKYHFGAEEKCDAPRSATNIFFAANYADLRHTVNKIESGHRLILTYNLTVSRGDQPVIPDYTHLHEQIGCAFTKWADIESKPLMFRLHHLYTEKAMNDGIDALKGFFL